MTRLLMCGDPHSEFGHIVSATQDYQPDAVVLLGDLELFVPLEIALAGIPANTSVLWIPGNHDTDYLDNFDYLFNSAFANGNIHCRTVNVGGITIAGLGGVVRSRVWDGTSQLGKSAEEILATCGKGNRFRNGLPLKHRSTIFREDVAKMKSLKADILVTHEAPSAHPHGFQFLDDIASSMGVRHAFHGHHHESIQYAGIWRGVGLRETVFLEI